MTVPLPIVDVELDVTPAVVEFDRIAGRFSNFAPVLGGRVDTAVRAFLKRRFESEGRVGSVGGQWRKLTTGYRSFKDATGHGNRKILQYSGDMMRAFTKRGDPHQVLKLGPDFYSLSVDDTIRPRARAHQFGLAGNPVRQIIPDPLPRGLILELRKIAKSYIVRSER